jgi:hypothetical protein
MRGAQLWTLTLSLVSGSVAADSVQHLVSVTGGAEYDSNPQLLTDDEVDAWRGIFEPGYQLLWRAGRYEIDANAGIRIERSSETNVSTNREDPRVSVSGTRTHAGGSLYSDVSYLQESTRITELEDTGVFSDDTRKALSFGFGGDHNLTAQSQLVVDATYEDISFDGDNFSDFETAELAGRLNYTLSRVNTVWIEGVIARYETDEQGVDDSDAYGGSAGLVRMLSDRWQVEVFAGFMDISGEGERTDWVGGVEASFTGRRSNFEISYARSSAASAAGGFEEADDVVARYDYSLSNVTTVTLSGQWRKNQSDDLGEAYSGELRLDRRLSLSWSLGCSLTYRGTGGEDNADAQVVALLLTYRPPAR